MALVCARVSRAFCFLGMHTCASVITRIIPGEFLRGFSCTAFASIRGYKPAVPLFPLPSPSHRRNTSKERVISDKLAVLCAKRLVNVRIPRMIIPFENFEKIPPLSSCVYLDNSSLEFLAFLFLQFHVSSPSNSRSSLSISEFFISFVAPHRDPRPDNRQRIRWKSLIPCFLNLLFHYYEILHDRWK